MKIQNILKKLSDNFEKLKVREVNVMQVKIQTMEAKFSLNNTRNRENSSCFENSQKKYHITLKNKKVRVPNAQQVKITNLDLRVTTFA